MPPADRSQSGFVSWLTALLYKLRGWTREEIVSDDPWDRGDSLFSDAPDQTPKAPEKRPEPETDAARPTSSRPEP